MRRTFLYIISLAACLLSCNLESYSQDTVDVQLKIRAALELSGPAIYISDKSILNTEGYFGVDLNEKRTVLFGGGYTDYSYSQYNYSYKSKGFFFRGGLDLNLMSVQKSASKYWGGIGFQYGISRFSSEIPFYKTDNYWGTVTSSVGRRTSWAHFIEAAPGVKAEIFRNVSLGWKISVRMLLYSGSGKDYRPLYIPGFGNAGKRISTGASYYITFNIPYKRITVITKPPEPEEPEEEVNTGNR
jgi:hypothetical protein